MSQIITVKISNCNNIDNGTITIIPGRLNIKYAMNGTGKTTIAKAIEAYLKEDGSLRYLQPFKWQEAAEADHLPNIEGLESVKSVHIFNEDYLAQFVFKEDELLTDSFNVFVRTPDYDRHMKEIDTLMDNLKTVFKELPELDSAINNLVALDSSFGKATKTGKLPANSTLVKGLGKGNKIKNIPRGLESYTDYLNSPLNYKWLKWHNDGHSYRNSSLNCPFCSSMIKDKEETIKQIAKEFDPKTVEHLSSIVSIIDNLSKYFSDETKGRLREITSAADKMGIEAELYLKQIHEQIQLLLRRLLDLRGISYFSMKDVDKVSQYIEGLKIDCKFLGHLHSVETERLASSLNSGLDDVLAKVGKLQGEVAKQNRLIAQTIEENKISINNFLKSAGYRYKVDVTYENNTYKMQLRHFDSTAIVKNGDKYLSYGEKNALALVLFMYECLAKSPDLIILDDPISSFDKNKKYAVIDTLFRREKTLQGKTVLMLTHDLEAIIDIYTLAQHFSPMPIATYLISRKGILVETNIGREDINTFGAICDENISMSCNDIIKLTYLRRYYEIIDNDLPYQLLSNLLHRRGTPVLHGNEPRQMTNEEITKASDAIRIKLPAFDYSTMLSALMDKDALLTAYKVARCNYEKLQIFRIINQAISGTPNPVIAKFINETFHVENEYIMQVNPCKYELVPDYVIEECDAILSV